MVRYILYEYLIILYIKAGILSLIISLLGKRRNKSAFFDEEVECSNSDNESEEEEEEEENGYLSDLIDDNVEEDSISIYHTLNHQMETEEEKEEEKDESEEEVERKDETKRGMAMHGLSLTYYQERTNKTRQSSSD